MLKASITMMVALPAVLLGSSRTTDIAEREGIMLANRANSIEFACDKYCKPCLIIGHQVTTQETGIQNYLGHVETSCVSASSCVSHWCGMDEEEEDGAPDQLASLVTDLQGASVPVLRAALAHAPDKIVVNQERMSLQLVSCEGRIAVNLPLTSAELASLAQ